MKSVLQWFNLPKYSVWSSTSTYMTAKTFPSVSLCTYANKQLRKGSDDNGTEICVYTCIKLSNSGKNKFFSIAILVTLLC
jgi:hypothetical protein